MACFDTDILEAERISVDPPNQTKRRPNTPRRLRDVGYNIGGLPRL